MRCHAEYLGMDPLLDRDLLIECLRHPLPKNWKPFVKKGVVTAPPRCSEVCYFNLKTGVTLEIHPVDLAYRKVFEF